MAWYDSGNPPIDASAISTNADTSTLLVELDSTVLGTKDFQGSQSGLYRVSWILGASTVVVMNVEHALSTGIGSTGIRATRSVVCPVNQSAQFVLNYKLEKDDRLRVRANSSMTGNIYASAQAERLT